MGLSNAVKDKSPLSTKDLFYTETLIMGQHYSLSAAVTLAFSCARKASCSLALLSRSKNRKRPIALTKVSAKRK